MRGTLFLVVGPSGAGKDTLIAAARERLLGPYLFPQRVITRAPGHGEDNIAVDAATFEAQERAGAFALSWRAHGQCYGVPGSIEAALERGTHVVVNVSRDSVGEARNRFAPSLVIEIAAPADVCAARLTARQREPAHDIDSRLARERAVAADVVITNDGALDAAIAAFLATLEFRTPSA